MSDEAIIETRIDADLRDRAEKVLRQSGMTIPDLVRLAITRTAEDGTVPFGLQGGEPGYDAWFREQVQEALDDPRPSLSNEEAREHMAKIRRELAQKMGMIER